MGTAQIIDLDLAREAHEINALHAEQLAAQKTTLALAIEIGKHLQAVKASLPHGQFMPWVEANCTFKAAQCARYMQAAKFTSGINLPDSSDAPTTIREAAALGAAKQKKVGLPAAVLESAGVNVPWGIRVNSSRKEVLKAVEDAYGKPLPKDVISGSEEAEEVVAAWMQAEIKANPKAHRAEVEALSLPEQYQQQVDLAINVYKAELQVAEEKRIAEAKRLFDEELKKQVSDLREQLLIAVRESREEIFVWQERSKTLDKWMSEEEFKKVQSFLHPDKHPQAMQAKASEAFQIFSRLKQHLEPDKRKLKSAASLWGAR